MADNSSLTGEQLDDINWALNMGGDEPEANQGAAATILERYVSETSGIDFTAENFNANANERSIRTYGITGEGGRREALSPQERLKTMQALLKGGGDADFLHTPRYIERRDLRAEWEKLAEAEMKDPHYKTEAQRMAALTNLKAQWDDTMYAQWEKHHEELESWTKRNIAAPYAEVENKAIGVDSPEWSVAGDLAEDDIRYLYDEDAEAARALVARRKAAFDAAEADRGREVAAGYAKAYGQEPPAPTPLPPEYADGGMHGDAWKADAKEMGRLAKKARRRRLASEYEAQVQKEAWAQYYLAVQPRLSDYSKELIQKYWNKGMEWNPFKTYATYAEELSNITDNDERQLVASLLYDMKPEGASTSFREACNRFARGTQRIIGNAGEELFSVIARNMLADDEYQAMQETFAAVRTATNYKDRTNDWGVTDVLTQTAEIVPYSLITLGLTRGAGSVATALGGGATAAGAAGFAASTGAMWLDEMREMEMQVAAAGGDVTSPGFQRTKAAWAFAHACVESLQWAQLRGLTPLQRADLFGRVFNVARRSGNALMRIAESGVYESLEEDIQDSMEAAFVAYNLDRNVAREAINAGSEAFAQSIGPMMIMGGGHLAANRAAGNVSEWDVAQMATVVDEINDRAKRKAGMLDLLDDNAFRGTLGRIARGYRAALGQEGGGDAYLRRIGIDDPAARRAVGGALDEMYRAIMRDGPVGEDGVIEQMREQGMIGSDEEEQNLRAAIQSVNADAEARRPGLLRKYFGGRNAKARADVVSQMFPGARLTMDDDGREFLERDITTRDADGNETTRKVRIAIRYDEGLANPIDPEVANPASPKYDEGADDEIRKGWNAMAERVEGAVQYSPEDWRKLGETDWNAKAAVVAAVVANATREGYFTFTTPEGRDLTREEAERGDGGVMTLNPYALPGVELHEGSHGFVALLRALGILTPDDEANLRQQFGEPKISTESFDEEAFVSAVMKAMAGQVDFADTTMLERVGRGLREFFVKLGGLAGMYREENKWIRARQEDMIQAVLRGDFHGVGANGMDFRTPEPETRGNVAAPPPPPEQPPAETGETAEAEPGETVPQGTAETPPAPEPAPAETQPAQPTPAPLPARTTRTTSTSRTRVSGHYEVADAFDGIFISTDEGYDPRGLGYQNRVGEDGSLTTTQGRKDRVRNMANNLAVDILGPNSLADHGAPVLAADMSAVTANTRLEAIRTAYREGKAAEYADAVRGWAAQLGIAIPEGVAHPALVFVLDQMDDEKLLDFVSDANHTGKAAMTDVQQAQEDAGRMRSGGSNVMRLLHPSPTGRLDGVENAGFMTRALDMLGDESLKNSDGTPNAKADRRIRLALLAMALEGSPVRDAVLREAIENYDNLGANRVVSGITAAAPLLAASAQTAEDLDLSGELGAALADYIEFRRTAATGDGAMDEWLAQDDMFAPRPEAVQTLLREFWARRFSPSSVAALLGEYARRAEAAGSAAQGDLLGDARPEKDAILRMAADATRDEGNGDDARRWSIILGEKGAERLANAADELRNLATAKAALKRWREDGDWEKLTDEQRRRILMATGWQVGADGKWRREAPDFKRRKVADDKWTVGDDGTRQTALGNLITQSVLFTAYPDMREMPVTFRPSAEMGDTLGSTNGETITLQDKYIKDGMLTEKGRKVLTHEVQHAIQDREGFGLGTSPRTEAFAIISERAQALRDSVKAVARKYNRIRKSAPAIQSAIMRITARAVHDEDDAENVVRTIADESDIPIADISVDEYDDMVGKIISLAQAFDQYDNDTYSLGMDRYRRSAGEVEARNASSRKWFPKMGELSPRALGKLLSDTEDVAREDQIVRGVVEDAVQKADRRWSIISTRGAERLGVGTLEEAKNLRLNGADRWEIWQRTGWYVDPDDGKWRIEIRDVFLGADMEKAKTLGEFAHGQVFDAYPELKNVRVEWKTAEELGDRAGWAGEDYVALPKPGFYDDQFGDILMHEIEHHVQRIEGLAKGSNKQYERDALGYGAARVAADETQARERKAQHDLRDDASEFVKSLAEPWLREWYNAKVDERGNIDYSDWNDDIPTIGDREIKNISDVYWAVFDGSIDGEGRFGSPLEAWQYADEERGPLQRFLRTAGAGELESFLFEMGDPADPAFREQVNKLNADFDAATAESRKALETAKAENDKSWDNLHNIDRAGEAAYMNAAGEREARMVEARRQLNPKQRAEIPPFVTKEVVRRDQYGKRTDYSYEAQKAEMERMRAEDAAPQNAPAPVRRNSISITGTDGRMGFGGESYVVAAIATDILVGKKRPDIEYERLKRILAPKSEADVAALVAEARSAVRGDAAAIAGELLKAGRPGDAVNAIAAEAEAARMGDALYDAAMGGARAGARYGRKAQEGEGRAWAKLLNGHNSIGGLHEVSQGVGMGVLAMAEGAAEDSLVREPEARPETARGEPKPKEEKKEPTADEAEAMADAARERAEQTMADWEVRERTGQTEKARREKAALEAKEDADATEEEKAAAEDNAEAGDDEDIETPRPEAIPADILAQNNMDVTNAVDFEALLGIAVRNLIIRRSNGAFNAATVWTSAENLLAYRDTLAQLLGDIGKAMMDPANGEEIRRVMKELATLQAYAPRPQSVKRGRSANNVSQAVKHMDTLAAAILTRIFRNAIVKSQKKLTRECGKGIRERRGRTKRIDMMEEDIRSRLFKNDLLLAQFAERCIWWTPTKVAKEAAKLRAVLDARRRAYDEEGQLDPQMLGDADVDQDLVFHRAAMRLALLERYGGMRFKTRGEIKELTAELLGWLDKGLADHAAKWEAQHRIHERGREKAKKAYGRGEDEPRHAEPDKRSAAGLAHRLADAMTATVRQRLDLMSVRKGMTAEQRKTAREITDRIMLLISSGSQMRARLQDQYKREFHDALADAARANGMTARALYTALSAKIDADFSRRISKQGNWGDAALTLDQLLNVYAYLCQTASYADNISKHGRDGQRQEIEDYLARTPEGRAGIRLVQNLRDVYRQRRGALSEAWDQFMGTPMFSPDPLYTPVRMHVDGRDGFGPQIEGGWNPVPPGFAERVKNGRDVEETASLTALYAQNCALAANAIAFGMRGIELRSVLANKEVVAAMERAHGKEAVRDLLNQVADTLNGSAPQGERTYAAEAIKWLNSAATYSSLGFNPFSALKQTTSIPAWSGVLTPEDYAKVARWAMEATYSKEAWAAMRELCDAPGFVARYGSTGFAQSVRDVLKDPEANAWRKFLSLQMQMIQMGDFLPGIMVGQGLYRQLFARYVDEQGMPVNAAKERAATETWALIEESQQSDKMQNLIKDMRRGGVVAKSLYKFATSPVLQASQEIQALRLWKRTGWKWDSDERRRYFNVFMANHFLMPAAMYLISALMGFVKGREDPWENWQRELAAMFLMGSFSRFFLFGSLTEQAVRTMLGLKVYNNMEMPATQWAQRMATKSAATIADAWDLDADAVADDLWDIAGTMSAPARIVADRRRNERRRQKKSKTTTGWKGY